jgi:hypothetical protein
MAIIYQYFDKDTFEPEKNYFSTEKVRCSRQETDPEVQLSGQSDKWRNVGFHCISWGCLIGGWRTCLQDFSLMWLENWYWLFPSTSTRPVSLVL